MANCFCSLVFVVKFKPFVVPYLTIHIHGRSNTAAEPLYDRFGKMHGPMDHGGSWDQFESSKQETQGPCWRKTLGGKMLQWSRAGVLLNQGKGMVVIFHGSLNVPIEHNPTFRYMVYNGYYKVMSNISKMGQLPTPVFRMIGSLKLCMCHCCSYNIRTLQNSPILVEKHPRYSAMGLWNKQLYLHVLHDLTQSH